MSYSVTLGDRSGPKVELCTHDLHSAQLTIGACSVLLNRDLCLSLAHHLTQIASELWEVKPLKVPDEA